MAPKSTFFEFEDYVNEDHNHTHKFHAKASGDCGGGVSGSFNLASHTHSSPTSMVYHAIKVIGLYHDFTFRMIKDRDGHAHGEMNKQEAIEMMARMIASNHFSGSMDMFQETVAMRIVEKINEVLDGKDIIPKGDIEDASSIQGSSKRNGSERNSLLQRFVQLRR